MSCFLPFASPSGQSGRSHSKRPQGSKAARVRAHSDAHSPASIQARLHPDFCCKRRLQPFGSPTRTDTFIAADLVRIIEATKRLHTASAIAGSPIISDELNEFRDGVRAKRLYLAEPRREL
jgi:hypothetical protein